MARTMLNENGLPTYFWAEAVNTTCYILNRVLTRPILNKTPYELWKGRTPNLSHFRVFSSKCFLLNKKSTLKFCRLQLTTQAEWKILPRAVELVSKDIVKKINK